MIKRFTLLEKFICMTLALLFLCISVPNLKALEFQVDKGVAFNFTAPLLNSTNTSIYAQGANNTAFLVHSNDNTTFATAGTNCTIIGASGVYLFQLNATEMNHSRIGVLYNASGCLEQYFVINTVPKEALDVVDGNVDSILEDTGNTLDTLIKDIPTVAEFEARSLVSADYFVVGDYTVPPTVSEIQTELEENGASILDSISDKLPTNYIMGSSDQTDKDDDIDAILVDTGTTLDTIVDNILEDTGTTLPATLTSMSGATFNTATDSLEAIRNQGDAAWITATGFSTHAAADVWSVATRILTALDEDDTTIDLDSSYVGGVSVLDEDLTTIDLDGTTLGTITGLSAAALADFFDTDSTTDYATSVTGSVVKEIADNAGGLTEAGIADAVWDEAISGHTTAGTTGKKLNDNPILYDVGP